MSREYEQFNCYGVLNISPTASPSEIKAAYKKASLASHPDRGGSHDAQLKVSLAYEVLSDPLKCYAHDIFWKVRLNRQKTNEQKAQSNTRKSSPRQKQNPAQAPMSAFKCRLENSIQAKKGKVWNSLDEFTASKTTQFLKERASQKKTFYQMLFWGVVTGLVGIYFPLLWAATAWLAYASYQKFNNTSIGCQNFALFSGNTESNLRSHARHLAEQECQGKINDLDNYIASTASIFELAMKPSSLDDSEVHVVRRLTVALFLMGYTPESYDNEHRILLFTDGDEKLAVRFRHRTGAAINITYVQKLQAYMSILKASHGILLCSPGLSGNAAQYAANHKIHWYMLESMNEWIDGILESNYAGPTGDLMEQLNKLNKFISHITPKVASSPYGYRRSHRRYRYY